MRKALILFLFALMLFSASMAEQVSSEICFSDIPWLTDENVTTRMLDEKQLLRNSDDHFEFHNMGIYLTKDETGFVWPMTYKVYNDVCLSALLGTKVKGRIAGYPIKDMVLSFAYDGEYRLISVKVELVGADFSSIKNKLEKVYGKGAEHMNEDGAISIDWLGLNNSCVLLFSENPKEYYELVYGRIDAKDILDNCLFADPDDFSGL